jgi:putative restriction endonuclease
MRTGRNWNREELLIMMNIYEKLPFGLFDQAQPVIQDLAKKLHRSPGSVAMKLANLASLDPAIQARGRKGLTGASNLDRQVWAEFHANRERLAPESEDAFRKLFTRDENTEVEVIKTEGVCVRKPISTELPIGPTEGMGMRRFRRGQQYFRQMVLNAYDSRCCVTGIGIRELLVASHIKPWGKFPEARLNQQNGICLSRLHDGAFDGGLITFDEDCRLVLSRRLKSFLPQAALEQHFVAYERKPISLPPKIAAPNLDYLKYHREKVFERGARHR